MTMRSLVPSRILRGAMLAAMLAFLACRENGGHYAPLGADEMPPAAVVAGTIRDASRRAIADALVVLEPARNGVAASKEWLSKHPDAILETPGRRVTTTNDLGRYAFDGIHAGDYFLQVIADDHLGAMRSLSLPSPQVLVDTVYVDVDLTPTGTFSGVATLENATEHQGTVVYAEGTSYVAVTDPAGNYALTNVPVGSYSVRAEHAHYLEDTESGTITTAGENVTLANMLLKIDSNIPPVATIVSASPLFDLTPVDFVASGSDADGTVVLYEWDWEDDGTFDYASAMSANASHTYGAAGTYRAKLRVTDDKGAIALAVIDLTLTSQVSTRVYVSTTGNDTNDGSISSPVRTLARAYQIVQSQTLEILVEEGSYSEVPSFQAGIAVLGGRTLPTWNEGAGYSQFNYSATRATADNITTATLVRRVTLNMQMAGAGMNSIALYSLGSTSDLRFEECKFITANGPAGQEGADGSAGVFGGVGRSSAGAITARYRDGIPPHTPR